MRVMPRSLPLALLVLVLATGARAQQVERIEIIEWGIYQRDRIGDYASPGSASGRRYHATNIRLRQATTTVPALLGMTFGMRYKVVGAPPGATVGLKLVVRFPRQGLTNPAKGKTFSSAEYHTTLTVGADNWEGYTLDYEWEVETGPWTMEIWHDGRKLADKTFMVTRLVSSAR